MKDERFANKIALITGGTRGIGKAISLKLLSMGFTVAINGVASKDLPNDFINSIKESAFPDTDNSTLLSPIELKKRVLYIQADIATNEGRENIIKSLMDRFHRIDVLVNNAGIGPSSRMDILEATEESFDHVLETNLKGPYFLTQKVAKLMIKEMKTHQNLDYKPKIINISSISSYTSSTNRGEYCISKAGVSMMTKLYADRLAEFGIGVFEIQPGIIKTDMTAGVQEKYDRMFKEGITPINRWGTPEDVAQAVEAIVSDHFPYSTGQVFEVDGGFHLRRL
jgi:3-oxoacyl-[acyl-carrier protein] reductase